jgi:hypothetical protein
VDLGRSATAATGNPEDDHLGFPGNWGDRRDNCQPISLSLLFGVVILRVAGLGGGVYENGTWVPDPCYVPRIPVVVTWISGLMSGHPEIQGDRAGSLVWEGV